MSAGWCQRLPAWSPTAWAAGGAAGLVAVALLVLLVTPREFYTGTNSVRSRAIMLELPGNAQLCLPGLFVPGGTGRIEFKVDTSGRPTPAMALELELEGRTLRSERPAGPPSVGKLAFAFDRLADDPEVSRGSACITTLDGNPIGFGGVPGLVQGDDAPLLNGEVVAANRIATWYRPPEGERRSILSQLPTLFERQALFKPGWVGAWTYWLLYLVILPALLGLALWVLVSAERRRRLPLLIALLTFGNAAAWAHISPAFQSPDESEHYAYVESLAERGKPLSSVTLTDPAEPYSSHESVAIEATRVFANNEGFDGRPPWIAHYEEDYERRIGREQPPRDDGGGFTIAASAHSPVYYALLVPAYELGSSGGVFAELALMRLTSALLGAVVALCAVLLVLELLPGRRVLAAAAGLLAGFQPMFGFMSGSVNNDMGVNAAAAVVLLLLFRTLRRGFGVGRSFGLGAALAVMPLMKGTGYALYPAAILTLLLATWRWRHVWRQQARGLAALAAGFAAVYLTWSVSSSSLDRSSFTTPGGGAPGEGFGAMSNIPDALAYTWQVFLPPLPFMTDHWTQAWPAFYIYGKRGWGAFGWYSISWPEALYYVLMAGMVAIAVLGIVTLWRRWDWVRNRGPEVLVALAAVLGVAGAVHFAYYTETAHGDRYPEQGRYLFPVISVLATMGVGAMFAVGRRAAQPAAAGLAAGVIAFSYASMWLVLAGFYFLVLT